MLERRTAQQQQAQNPWAYVSAESNHYTTWSLASAPVQFILGPPVNATSKSYLNSQATSAPELPRNSVAVTAHRTSEDEALAAVTVFVKSAPGFNARTDDWYCAHYLPHGTAIDSPSDQRLFGKRLHSPFQLQIAVLQDFDHEHEASGKPGIIHL